MPISGVKQPETIYIDEYLRLKKYNSSCDFALPWYQNLKTLKLVDNRDSDAYDMNKLKKMFSNLNNIGELYFIEVKKNGYYIPIGDVTFYQDDMPIVIGVEEYRSQGIGYKIVKALINRAKDIGFKELRIKEIYSFNIGSQKTFEKAGFIKDKATKNGYSYVLCLS